MKYVLISVGIIVIAGVLAWNVLQPSVSPTPPTYTGANIVSEVTTASTTATAFLNAPLEEVIAEGLSIPWEILFLPDGELLVTERSGNVVLLKQGVSIPIDGVRHVGEGGLLGAALHPDFVTTNLVYFYQTTETEAGLQNRIDRYTLSGTELQFERTIIDGLPGARTHDGGRITFGPDGYLYVTLGDAGDEATAQRTDNLAGSILRYTAEGDIPSDNPFNNAIYSYGHRNAQGLAWDSVGNLWSSEHGRSGIQSGYDEINRIILGANYGWPEVEGDEVRSGFTAPALHSSATTTWAPGGLAYLGNALYMPGLRGRSLYKATLSGTEVVALEEFFVGEYGRLRTVTVGPDNLLYLTTSNRDGRGIAESSDDRIIRINPVLLGE